MNKADSKAKLPGTFRELMAAFPQITDAAAWARAQGVARIAMADVMRQLPQDVLWYHADYVSPSWGSRLNYVEKIGVHMFFRA